MNIINNVFVDGINWGFMWEDHLEKTIEEFKNFAEMYMKKESPDHIVYATADRENDKIVSVHFYNHLCLDDKEFQSRIGNLDSNRQIYAIHKLTN